MTDAITSLIERLEGASEGSRELDAEIYCVFNENYRPGIGVQLGAVIRSGGMRTPEPVTSGLDTAIALAERVLPGWQFVMATGQAERGPPWVQAYPHLTDEDVYLDAVAASTLPIAICIAVLRAKQSS